MESLKDSGIAAEDKHGSGLGTSYDREITIDKTIEIFEGIKKGICPWYPELYCDKAINIMRKYQKMQEILEKVWNIPSCMIDKAECLDKIMETYRTVRCDKRK